jgi:hypothetical protein
VKDELFDIYSKPITSSKLDGRFDAMFDTSLSWLFKPNASINSGSHCDPESSDNVKTSEADGRFFGFEHIIPRINKLNDNGR